MPRLRAVKWLVASALVAALLLAPSASASASGRVPQGFVGVDLSSPLYPTLPPGYDLSSQLQMMVASGVENVRATIDWATAQPYQSWSGVPSSVATQYSNVGGVPTKWGPIDQLVGLAAYNGLTVLPTILDAPKWDGMSGPGNSHPIPRRNGPYAAFVKALVQRYGRGGSFWQSQPRVVPITQWQIWNEPNIPDFWPTKDWPNDYVALLKAANTAIKSVDKRAQVVLGGLPNFSWLNLGQLYEVKGFRNAFDVVALHPYTKQPMGVITILRRVRRVMDAARQGRKPIIADEISWPSSVGQTDMNGKLDFVTTQAGQAQNLGRLIPLLAKYRKGIGLAGFDYYTWATVEQPNEGPFGYAGLLKITPNGFVQKPVYSVYRKLALGLEGCAQKGQIATVCAEPAK